MASSARAFHVDVEMEEDTEEGERNGFVYKWRIRDWNGEKECVILWRSDNDSSDRGGRGKRGKLGLVDAMECARGSCTATGKRNECRDWVISATAEGSRAFDECGCHACER